MCRELWGRILLAAVLRVSANASQTFSSFISDLVEVPGCPKDKVWKLSRKVVPLKSE